LACTAILLAPEPDVFRRLALDEIATTSWPVDKLVHGIGYFALYSLAAWAFRLRELTGRHVWWLGACLSHAALTEVAQCWIASRSGDIKDWLADAAGLLIAAVMFRLIHRIRSW
jgi:VanZ family protein